MERYFVSHFRRNSLGVRPKCFLNTRVKCCGYSKPVAEVVRRKEQRQGNTAHYRSHQKTDHFQKYKQGTLHMVKDLKLPTMKLIFKKQR